MKEKEDKEARALLLRESVANTCPLQQLGAKQEACTSHREKLSSCVVQSAPQHRKKVQSCAAQSAPQHGEKLQSSAAQRAMHYQGMTQDAVITRWNYEYVEDLIESIPHYDQMINSIQVMMQQMYTCNNQVVFDCNKLSLQNREFVIFPVLASDCI